MSKVMRMATDVAPRAERLLTRPVRSGGVFSRLVSRVRRAVGSMWGAVVALPRALVRAPGRIGRRLGFQGTVTAPLVGLAAIVFGYNVVRIMVT